MDRLRALIRLIIEAEVIGKMVHPGRRAQHADDAAKRMLRMLIAVQKAGKIHDTETLRRFIERLKMDATQEEMLGLASLEMIDYKTLSLIASRA